MTARAGPMILSVFVVSAAVVLAQGTPPQDGGTEAIRSDSDPSRPVLFSIRPEFYALDAPARRDAVIFRYDAAVSARRRPGGVTRILLRFELPVVDAMTESGARFGVGDAYAQMLVVPAITRKLAFAIGSGVVIPTASDRLTGGGNLVFAPVAAPLWRFRRGLVLVKVQNFTSVAGDSSRRNRDYLLVTPTWVHAIARRWWMLLDSEKTFDWERSRARGLLSGMQLGRLVGVGTGVWVKPEIRWAPHPDGVWNLKFGVVWYQ